MGFQIVDALQVGSKQADDQIAGLNRRRGEHIGHAGTAVQNDKIHQPGGGVDQLEYHGVFDFRITQRILTGGIAHQADERIAFEHRDMACHQRGVDLYAA